ncbi:hypothetical protein ABBQ38_012865 [Trebouxia sp. C0009 RCD-2024]
MAWQQRANLQALARAFASDSDESGSDSNEPMAFGKKYSLAATLQLPQGERPEDVVRAFSHVQVTIRAATEQNVRESGRYQAVKQHAHNNDQLALLRWVDLAQFDVSTPAGLKRGLERPLS